MPILDITISTDKDGKIDANESTYKPSDDVKNITQQVLRDFSLSNEIMNSPHREFNDKSLVERMNLDQKSFNNFVDHKSDDPDEAWKSNAKRPVTRNKIISIAAHVTGALLFPNIFAQNDQDEEDKDAAQVMRDLMEWAADQSEYAHTFLFAVIAALVNPAVIIHTEFTQSMRNIKEIKANGKWKEKEIIDEIFSGFQDALIPLDELYINDIYEHNIQKQGYLIRRRAIDYTVAKIKYGDVENFQNFVEPGLQIMFSEESGMFYEQKDDSLEERLVEEVIYYNRNEDLELVFVNGVIMTEPDQPNPRKDKMYPFAKSGFEPIDEGRFFYFKSLADKLGPDQDVIDTLYQMVIDGTFMQLMPPTAVFGDEIINSSITTPGTVTVFDNATKLQKIDVGNNLSAGYNTLQIIENSISESSQSPTRQGLSGPGQQTAFEVRRLERNASIVLGLFGKMIGFLVKDFGVLRVGDILQHITVGQVDNITTGLKFKSFIIQNQMLEGKARTKRIVFDMDMPEEITPGEELKMSEEMLALEGIDSDTRIVKVNPKIFRERKFIVRISADQALPPSDAIKKALNLEAFDRAIQLPFTDQKALTRDLLFSSYASTRDNPNKYISKNQPQQPVTIPTQQPEVKQVLEEQL